MSSSDLIEREFLVRHRRTDRVVGTLKIALPRQAFDRTLAPYTYYLAVCPPLEDILPLPVDGTAAIGNPAWRKATIYVNCRRYSFDSVWVDNSSELTGVIGYTPF